MPDWLTIKNEYITGNISYRKLAEKHRVSFSSLRYRAEKESWLANKEKQQHKISTRLAQKSTERIIAKEDSRIERMYALSDKVGDLINKALDTMVESDSVDTHQLRQISSTLKDIKEIQTTLEDPRDNETLEKLDEILKLTKDGANE